MKTYLITEKAGRRVAGFGNTGVGTPLTMPEAQAEAALEAGELVISEAALAEASKFKSKRRKAPAEKSED